TCIAQLASCYLCPCVAAGAGALAGPPAPPGAPGLAARNPAVESLQLQLPLIICCCCCVAVLPCVAPVDAGPKLPAKKKIKPNVPMRKFHWEPVLHSDSVTSRLCW